MLLLWTNVLPTNLFQALYETEHAAIIKEAEKVTCPPMSFSTHSLSFYVEREQGGRPARVRERGPVAGRTLAPRVQGSVQSSGLQILHGTTDCSFVHSVHTEFLRFVTWD